jgi:hypothetical protein
MASARAVPVLPGAAVDGATHSVVVSFEVATTSPETAAVDRETTHWNERWLFQRPSHYRTHASGAVAVCPVCGAPADPDDSGECRYCRSDITTRTAGWLVTQTATNMKGAVRLARHRAQQVIEKVSVSPTSTNDRVRETAGTGDLLAQPAPAGTPLQPPRSGTPLQPPRAVTTLSGPGPARRSERPVLASSLCRRPARRTRSGSATASTVFAVRRSGLIESGKCLRMFRP